MYYPTNIINANQHKYKPKPRGAASYLLIKSIELEFLDLDSFSLAKRIYKRNKNV